MKSWLRHLLAGCRSARPPGRVYRARLELEALEDRCVPTVTYHAGAVLQKVEAQALYLGSDWQTNPTYAQQARTLDGFISGLVGGPYMDMLAHAGYGVGRGSADPGRVGAVTFNKNAALTDQAIQGYLQSYLNAGVLKPPDGNRLYLVFVEDNIAVQTSDGLISRTDFLGYHGAFAGRDSAGKFTDVRYVVVAYPGGTIANAAVANVSAVNDMTEVASHEVAEAVTDPDINYSALGWYDDTQSGEVADIVNQQFVALNGFAVQRVVDANDQAMTPAGAAPLQAASFVLLTNGRLYEHTASGWQFLDSGVAAISDQGIDTAGRAMVDVVLTDAKAYEYHDGLGWVFLDSNVKQAVAGQGVSYVLQTDGRLFEFRDAGGQWGGALAVGVASISAGTDRRGVNDVAVVFTSGTLSMYSDSTGWHPLCSTVQSASAGALGEALVLLRDGRAFAYHEATNTFTYLATGVAQVAAGVDPTGAAMIDLVYRNGTAVEQRSGGAWQSLATGVATVSKARAGLVAVVFTNGNAYAHTAAGWTSLCATARQTG